MHENQIEILILDVFWLYIVDELEFLQLISEIIIMPLLGNHQRITCTGKDPIFVYSKRSLWYNTTYVRSFEFACTEITT